MRIRIRSDADGAREDEDGFVRIAEIMSSPVVTVSEEASLEEVARVMGEHVIGDVPVLDGRGCLVGKALGYDVDREGISIASAAANRTSRFSLAFAARRGCRAWSSTIETRRIRESQFRPSAR